MKDEPRLLHISFNGNLAGTLRPQLPAGTELNKPGVYPEPTRPRVCFSPTPEQCFQAVFPNVATFFEDRNYPMMDFYIYQAVMDRDIGLVSNAEIVKNRWVWDAHITGETWATKLVRVEKVGKLRIFNTNKLPMLETHPFNDPNLPMRGVAPKGVHYALTTMSGSLRWAEGNSK